MLSEPFLIYNQETGLKMISSGYLIRSGSGHLRQLNTEYKCSLVLVSHISPWSHVFDCHKFPISYTTYTLTLGQVKV